MEIIKPGIKFDFIGKRYIALAISGIIILISLFGTLVTPGPNWGIDFAGGAEIEVAFKDPIKTGQLRDAMNALDMGDVKVQEVTDVGADNCYLIRIEKLDLKAITPTSPPPDGEDKETNPATEEEDQAAAEEEQAKESTHVVEVKLTEKFGVGSFTVLQSNYVGPRVGKELRNKGIMAVVYSLVLLLVYITLRFEFRYAVGAVLALVHDITITTGAFVWSHKEFNLAIVAALLTIIGYSLNDTIVVFDRIRENVRRMKRIPFSDMINASINETLSRTILTTTTTLITVFFLWLLGGGVIHDFAFALLVGIMVGTYSSIFVASSFVVIWEGYRAAKRSPAADNK